MDRTKLKIPARLIIIFLLVSIVIGAFGLIYYDRQRALITKAVKDELSTIADLKAHEITLWRNERIGDANTISESTYIASGVKELFENPKGMRHKEEIRHWMAAVRKSYQYQSLILFKTDGEAYLSTPNENEQIGSDAKRLVSEAIETRKIIFSDIYRSALPGNPIHVSLIAPLFLSKNGKTSPVGAVLLRIDPKQFLYPFIQSWPAPSKTAESILIHREGDHVVFLNELRHRKNTALSLRFPLTERQLPAAMAVQGNQGIVEGFDYRGMRVIAALKSIPDSPWFLVAKVDKEEIYAPIHRQARVASYLVILLIAATGLSIRLYWGGQAEESLSKTLDLANALVAERTKDLRNALRQNELILNSAGEGINMLDSEGKIIFSNPAALGMLGYEVGELIGKPSHETTHHSRPDGVPYPVEDCPMHLTILDGKVRYGNDEFLWRKDGKFFPVEYTCTPVVEEGRVAGTVVIFSDITERKHADENIRKSRESLAEAQRIAHLGNWDWNIVTNELKLSSDEIYQIFGLTPQQFGATYDAFIKFVHPEDLAAVQKGVEDALQRDMPYSIDHRIILPDGQERVVHEEAHVYRNETGRPVRMLGTVQDITDRKQAEEERSRLEAQLRQAQKMETIGTLAGGIAHDFNNILTPIILAATLAMTELPEKSPVQKELERILSAANRAKDLVRQILIFSRRGDQELKPIKVQKVIEDAIKLIRASFPATIEIRKDIEPDCGTVMADATQIHQVIMNLCTNAFHAMRERSGTLEIRLKEVADLDAGKCVRLTVRDSGQGMDAATMERIFDPFFTTKGVSEGTGLGLSVVHGIVTRHGGKITVQSAPGKGSTFHIYLPLYTGDHEKEIRTEGEPIPKGKERILFVDDEEDIVIMGKKVLEGLGYFVTVMTNGPAALEEFRTNSDKYDLVIADLTMPKMTGLQLAMELNRIKDDTPVIITTGFNEPIAPETLEKSKVRECVGKPYTLTDLNKAIRRALKASS